MDTHVHPASKRVAIGLRLGWGAKILETDFYDASDGHWRPAGESLSGGKLQRGCRTVWVRPNVSLSLSGKALLYDLVKNNQRLTNRQGRWQIIPSVSVKDDPRIDWPADDQAAQELISLGFVAPPANYPDVYGATDVGENFSKTH